MGENAGGPYLTIARILRPQGRKGEVAAEILTDFPDRFQQLQRVLLEAPDGGPLPVKVERAWLHKGRIILKLSGIDSIDEASRLRGLQVFVPWEDRAKLPANHYYTCELRGCRVMGERGEQAIGTVTEVEPTGGVDLLHVERLDGKGEVLIPLAQEICKRIDTGAKIIVIDPPADLLELNE